MSDVIKAAQAVIWKDLNGKFIIDILKEKTCCAFDYCPACEQENGNEILAMFEVESVRQGDDLKGMDMDDLEDEIRRGSI